MKFNLDVIIVASFILFAIIIIILILLRSKRKKSITKAIEINPMTHLQPSYYNRIPKWRNDPLKVNCNIYTFYKTGDVSQDVDFPMVYTDINSDNTGCLSGNCKQNTFSSVPIYTTKCRFSDQFGAQIFSHTCISENNNCIKFNGDIVQKDTVESFILSCGDEGPDGLCPGLLTLISLDYLIAGQRKCLKYSSLDKVEQYITVEKHGNSQQTATLSGERYKVLFNADLDYVDCNENDIYQKFVVNKYSIENEIFKIDPKGNFAEIIYRDENNKHKFLDAVSEEDLTSKDNPSAIARAVFLDLIDEKGERLSPELTVKWMLAPQMDITYSPSIYPRSQYISGAIESINITDENINANPGALTFKPSPTGATIDVRLIPVNADWSGGQIQEVILKNDVGNSYTEDNTPGIDIFGAPTSANPVIDLGKWEYNIVPESRAHVAMGDLMAPDFNFGNSRFKLDGNYGIVIKLVDDNAGSGGYDPADWKNDNRSFDDGENYSHDSVIGLDFIKYHKEVSGVSGAYYPNGYFEGFYIEFYEGTYKYETRKITNYVPHVGLIVFSPALAGLAVTGNHVRIFMPYGKIPNIFNLSNSDKSYYTAINSAPGKISNDLHIFQNGYYNVKDVFNDGDVQWMKVNASVVYGTRFSTKYLNDLTKTDGVLFDDGHTDKTGKLTDNSISCIYNKYGKSPPQLIYLSKTVLNRVKKSMNDGDLSEIIRNYNISDYLSGGYFINNGYEDIKSLQIVPIITSDYNPKIYNDHDPFGNDPSVNLTEDKKKFNIGLAPFLPYSKFDQNSYCNILTISVSGEKQTSNAYIWTQFIPYGQKNRFKNISVESMDDTVFLPTFIDAV